MDLSQWNQALMDRLVKRSGSPNDPFYLYVDDEVLAEISGIAPPQAAVTDFSTAFASTSFDEEFRKAIAWQRNGFPGDPPFLTALAIAVLAVTRDKGFYHANDVYRPLRELLGYADLDGAQPDGYEHMPSLWRIWNEWLEEVGSRYGIPTANADSGLSYQGWARSQAFLRHRDKQDIYRFFGERKDAISRMSTRQELVSLLKDWLVDQGSSSRLAALAGNAGVAQELGVALEASLKYWQLERHAATQPLRLDAHVLWDPNQQAFDLVAPLSGKAGVIGTVVRDFDGVEWELDSPTDYVALSSTTTNAAAWLDEPVLNWKFAENWWVSWNPPEDGILFFTSDALRLEWISTANPAAGSHLMVLIKTSSAEEICAELSEASVGNDPTFIYGSTPSVAHGYSWLTVDGSTDFIGSAVSTLLPKRAVRRKRNHRLVGGLKLADRSYLMGYEPDVVFSFHPTEPLPQVTVDGNLTEAFHHPRTRVSTQDLTAEYPLSQEFLDPGFHKVTVKNTQENTSTFWVSPPTAPALREPRFNSRARNNIIHFSLNRGDGHLVMLINNLGDVLKLTLNDAPRDWLAALSDATDTPYPERYFDTSWLDWARSVPARREANILLAIRANADLPWDVVHLRGDQKTLLAPPRVSHANAAGLWEVLQLFGQGAHHRHHSDEARELFERQQKRYNTNALELGQSAHQQNGRAGGRRGNRPQTQHAPLPAAAADRIEDNPFDSFLYWLTERGAAGALFPTAEAGFAWLWRQRFKEDPPDFRATIRSLEALGHVRRDGGRIIVQEPSMTWLPDSEALAVLAGARTEDTLPVLEMGEGAPDRTQDDALADTDTHIYTQQQQAATGEGVRPLAPTTILMQVGSQRPPIRAAHLLGMHFYNPSFTELEDGIPSLSGRLANADDQILSAEGAQIDEYIGSRKHLGGRWRELNGGIAGLRRDTFLRIHRRGGKRYAWWNNKTGFLVDCGWVLGQWAFHQDTPTEDLFGLLPGADDQFAIAGQLPLPPDLEHYLVSRSGLLPRTVTTRVRELNAPPTKEWRLYTNVPVSIAALVSKKLGHPWSRTHNSWPSELEEVEFVQ